MASLGDLLTYDYSKAYGMDQAPHRAGLCRTLFNTYSKRD